MKKRERFFTRLGTHLDIPHEMLPGGFSLLLCGQKSLSIQGCVQILEYTAEHVVLTLGKRVLRVEGTGLFCSEFETEKLRIIGTVTALNFEKEGEHAR